MRKCAYKETAQEKSLEGIKQRAANFRIGRGYSFPRKRGSGEIGFNAHRFIRILLIVPLLSKP